MKAYPPAVYRDHSEIHFEYRTAAILARVSENLIRQCESAELITSHIMLHGKKGLCFADVCKLKIIRHLHEDMGLDLDAVDFVLRYREEVTAMQRRLDEMEERMRDQEKAYRAQIRALRRQLLQRSSDE